MAIKYITQIKADELSDMMAAGKMRAGRGIKVERRGDCFEIGLDLDELTGILWCYIKNGTNTSNTNTYSMRRTASLDPNF